MSKAVKKEFGKDDRVQELAVDFENAFPTSDRARRNSLAHRTILLSAAAIAGIGAIQLFLELFTFHNPAGRQEIMPRKTNDVGGPRHVCLRVTNIDEVFAHVKSVDGVHLINDSPEYRPFFISPISSRQRYDWVAALTSW